ncbi:hypothetical protein GETHOR_22960 [Geothrix oryzae]|uniref:Uncharacterized protein n=1 Tax=Geothrix oryzae TaxID=2927975 RepID=A0ABM8DT22_9BACT|nr:DUF6544 family protein [Geothrix oryzae]BDU70195.1 hypothetical protein GETHOR_22960 [Geothrix oryzae]
MTRPLSLDDLWRSVPPGTETYDPSSRRTLPSGAQRFLNHAVAPGTRLPEAVRLVMTGTIRLKGWHPFEAEQVIVRSRGMIWAAKVRMKGLTIRGSDRLLEGRGAMHWALFGLIPFLRAEGPDITRSARGRLRAESIWLPSLLADPAVTWTQEGEDRLRAEVPVDGEPGDLHLHTDEAGRLREVRLLRWGNPGGGGFREEPFGGLVEAEETFQGLTIPTRLRVGWHPGTPRFDAEGEFFRAELRQVAFR